PFRIASQCYIAAIVFVVAAFSCSAQKKSVSFNESVVGKVAVMKSGVISFNGEIITLEQLRGELADIKSKNGIIWYYREAAHGVGPPIAAQVIKLVIENRLPISFSTEPDYSNFVDAGGTVKPRIVASQPGSLAPQDIFEPHMPAVDVPYNMDAVFAK